ncbi:MAG: hypothetical protein IIX68_05000, partial [Clostridia bacterium]|nr:hypothetical protein [Clostridia bacterium]
RGRVSKMKWLQSETISRDLRSRLLPQGFVPCQAGEDGKHRKRPLFNRFRLRTLPKKKKSPLLRADGVTEAIKSRFHSDF